MDGGDRLIGAAALIAAVLVVGCALLVVAARSPRLRELVGLLVPSVRLVVGLARDRRVPRSRRLVLVGLGAYLVMPIDLVPDAIPGIGHIDDALVVWLALRLVMRSAAPEVLAEHWTGSPAGLARLRRLMRLPGSAGEEGGLPTR